MILWYLISRRKCPACGQAVPLSEEEFKRVPWWRRLLFYAAL